MIKLNVWGGAGEHGRSAYLLSGDRFHILMDCGVKKEGAGEYPLIEPDIVSNLDAVLLSHAHEDHSVAIPLLYKMGYQGEVWTTRETREQLDTYFRAWRSNMERAGHGLPYEEIDVQSIRYRYLEDEAKAGIWFKMIPGLHVLWGRSGHLAGSVWFALELEGRRIFYSGDYTSESMLLQEDCAAEALKLASVFRSRERTGSRVNNLLLSQGMAVSDGIQLAGEPLAEIAMSTGISGLSEISLTPSLTKGRLNRPMDLAIVDAAYGTDRDTQTDKLAQLGQTIRETIARGGKVLLPMPSVGRGQEIILWAQEQFPEVPMIVEQGLVDGMKQLLRVPYWLREKEDRLRCPLPLMDVIERFLGDKSWQLPQSREDRERLLNQYAASLWFIPDGMMQSSLARWYYNQLADREENLILLTGHAAFGTFAQKLIQNPIEYGLCGVQKIRYKVHQGWLDVERMLQRLPARHTVLVHADKAETDRLREELSKQHPSSGRAIHSLSPGDELYV
ncbi:MBL fold metallo-hydrolase [Paenibacillus xylanilyticus]|uniref:MBL fold metallo-hydrolase n=1 Tax=Paenibacillus xylanilyticus TaxID=248903 RepID=A0A7Y6BWK4_9BACL|nr:MBL fold metallo-hydrolase [Paenibacillus xylanilyticus]NUU76217.1 MBL fold metallo-hydrolase [Paenibacillus xylanilyticus]